MQLKKINPTALDKRITVIIDRDIYNLLIIEYRIRKRSNPRATISEIIRDLIKNHLR